MSKVTSVQKRMMIDLAREHYPKVLPIFERGPVTDISVYDERECALMKSFMDVIVESVGDAYPDDDDKNDDAVLSVNIGSRILNDFVSGASPR